MDYAADAFSPKPVPADRASFYRDYTCPTCGGRVFLRRAGRRRAHFAHFPGEGSPECEEYHPGTGGGGSGGEHVRRPKPLSLYLALEGDVRSRPSWHLELLLPQIPDGHGRLVVKSGIGGHIPVSFVRLRQGPVLVRVRTQVDPIILSVIGSLDAATLARAELPIPGLDDDRGNLFRFTERGGRRIEGRQPMYWGRGYFIVWNRSLDTRWPSSLWRADLQQLRDWQCTCVELPAEADTRVSEWAKRFLGCSVERPPVMLSLVSPIYTRLVDDSFAIEVGSEVLAGVTKTHGSRMPPLLTHITSKDTELYELPDDDSLVLSLGGASAGRASISIGDEGDEEKSLSLTIRPPGPVRVAPNVSLQVRTQSGEESILPLHSEEADVAGFHVAAGHYTLKRLYLPSLLQVRLRWLPKGRPFWLEEDIVPEEHLTEEALLSSKTKFEELVFFRMMSRVDESDQVVVDIGNYGSLHLRGRPVLPNEAPERTLDSETRERIAWLLALPDPRSAEVGEHALAVISWPVWFSLTSESPASALPAADRQSLQAISGRGAWSSRLEPHLRYVVHQVALAVGAKQ
jgi:hypothetical protein